MTESLYPPRYNIRWQDPFEAAVFARLTANARVLDIGSGRHPAVPVALRPNDITYVGLDLSRDELDAAGPGAYTEAIEADATVLQPKLVEGFDLVVSWQVLEHVRDLEQALENARQYLVPGGRFVALFSGSWSAFGIINRMLPHKLGKRIVEPIMHRKERNTPVFPAYYDKCYDAALRRIVTRWDSATITPLYNGAGYFAFSRFTLRGYLAYENFIANRQVANLATHYLLIAER